MVFYLIQSDLLKFYYIFNLLKNLLLFNEINRFKMLFFELVQFNALKNLLFLIIQFLKKHFEPLFLAYISILLCFM